MINEGRPGWEQMLLLGIAEIIMNTIFWLRPKQAEKSDQLIKRKRKVTV
jgi:hypothetical protein